MLYKACMHYEKYIDKAQRVRIVSGTFHSKQARSICRVCRKILRSGDPWFAIWDNATDFAMHVECMHKIVQHLKDAETAVLDGVKIREWSNP